MKGLTGLNKSLINFFSFTAGSPWLGVAWIWFTSIVEKICHIQTMKPTLTADIKCIFVWKSTYFQPYWMNQHLWHLSILIKHCSYHIIPCLAIKMQYIICIEFYALYTMHHIISYLTCTLHHILCIVFINVCYALYSMHCVINIVSKALYYRHCILCIV